MNKVRENYLIEFRDILGINRTEALVLVELEKKKGLSVKEILEALNKDRTTVQKILLRLKKIGYVEKRQMNLTRGFMYVYYLVDKRVLEEKIEKKLVEDLTFLKGRNKNE